MSLMPLLFRSSILRTAQTTVNIMIGLVMLPFMISILGEELYGIWILIGGFAASLHLMDFGFASAVTRFMVRHLTEKDYQKANDVISSALAVYTFLAVLIVAVTFAIALVSSFWVSDPKNLDLVFLLIVISGISLALEFPFKAFAGVSIAYMRHDLNALSQIVVKIIATAVSVFLLLQGYELIGVALVGLGSSIVSNIIFFIIAKFLFKQMEFSLTKVSIEKIKELAGFSFWAFLNDAANLLNKKIDIFMIGAFLGVSTLTFYYVALRLVEYTLLFFGRATGITMPIFTQNYSDNNQKKLKDNVLIFLRVNFILGLYAVLMFLIFGESLIEVWMGKDFNAYLAYVCLCVLISGKILLFISGPLASVLMALNRHQPLSYLSFLELLISASLIYFFIGVLDFGIIGASAGVIAPLFLTRCVILPIIVEKRVGLALNRVYSNLLRPSFFILIAAAINFSMDTTFFKDTTILSEIYFAIVASFVYWGLALSSLTGREWGYLFKILPSRLSETR